MSILSSPVSSLRVSPSTRTQSRFTKAFDKTLNILLALASLLAILAWRFPVFSSGLYASRSTFDFGTVKSSSIVQHTFTATNLHPWPVTVTGVPGGCGCTRGILNRKTPFRLLPLQSVQVAVRLDTWGKKESVRETIKLTTQNEADDIRFVLQGTVHP